MNFVFEISYLDLLLTVGYYDTLRKHKCVKHLKGSQGGSEGKTFSEKDGVTRKEEYTNLFQINMHCVDWRIWAVFPKSSQYKNAVCARTHTHTRAHTYVCLGIRTGLRALRQSCTHRKDFDKNVPHFTPTSTALFNMWNTSSTNPESVLSCFLRGACVLPELALYTATWITL